MTSTGGADLHLWRVGFAHVGDQPDRLEIADRDRSDRSAPALMYWPRPTLRWITVPAIGAATIDLGADAVDLLEMRRSPRRCGRGCAAGCAPRRARSRRSAGRPARRPDRTAPARDPSARRPGSPAGRAGASRSSAPASSRDFAFSTPATAVTRSFWPCTYSLASIANNGRAALDVVARLGDQAADPAGVGREDRRRGVLVDGDLAVGRALVAEGDLAHRRELEARPLRLARPEGAVGIAQRPSRAAPRRCPGRCSSAQKPTTAAATTTAPAPQPQAVASQARWSKSVGSSIVMGTRFGQRCTSEVAAKLVPSHYDNLTRRPAVGVLEFATPS